MMPAPEMVSGNMSAGQPAETIASLEAPTSSAAEEDATKPPAADGAVATVPTSDTSAQRALEEARRATAELRSQA